MALTKLTDNLNIIQTLADQPTQTATELKQAFDSASNTIKTYINSTLTSEVDTILANLTNTTSSLSSTVSTLSNTVSGQATTLAGLKSGATTKITIGSSTPSSLEDGEIYIQYFE